MVISRHFEKQVLQSQIQPLQSVLRVQLRHTRRLRSLYGAASSHFYVANGNMTDVRMFQIFTILSPVWQGWNSQISNQRRNIPTNPTPKGSPCTVARETPWRGCASDSLGPAVDTGDEGGWALRECKNPRQNLSPVTYTAVYPIIHSEC